MARARSCASRPFARCSESPLPDFRSAISAYGPGGQTPALPARYLHIRWGRSVPVHQATRTSESARAPGPKKDEIHIGTLSRDAGVTRRWVCVVAPLPSCSRQGRRRVIAWTRSHAIHRIRTCAAEPHSGAVERHGSVTRAPSCANRETGAPFSSGDHHGEDGHSAHRGPLRVCGGSVPGRATE
jgi:hypothetical protein